MSVALFDVSFTIYNLIGYFMDDNNSRKSFTDESLSSTKAITYTEDAITRSQAPVFVPATYTVKNVKECLPPSCPTEGDNESAWNIYIEKTTTMLKGNAGDAQIIFLGETHSEKWHRLWARALIMHHSSGRGDIVLLEGRQSLKKAKSNIKIGNVTLLGWDSDYYYYKSIQAIKSCVGLINKYNEVKPSSRWSSQDIEEWQALQLFRKECNKAREESLIATIAKMIPHLQTGKKVFVISGSNHLHRLESVLMDFKFTDAQSSTVTSLKTAILIPKNFTSNFQLDELSHMQKLASACRV
jgi:hypothetical protein